MYRPLLIEQGYKKIFSASSQIARAFWEKFPTETISRPVVLCEASMDDITSNNHIYTVTTNRYLKFLCKILNKLGLGKYVYFPDISSLWAFKSKRKVCKIAEDTQVSYVHSIGQMFSSHLIALRLKKKTGIKWIAQFNDPWVENESLSQNPILRYLHAKFERRVADNADVIIHNNTSIIDSWKLRYGPEIMSKIRLVPLSYNIPDLPALVESKHTDKVVISHIGSCYGDRDPMPFIRAAESFVSKYPELGSSLVVNFIGLLSNDVKDYISSHKLDFIHTFSIDVPNNIMHFYDETDIFLAIDLNINESKFFPSKLMTYYYYRKPILGISNDKSVLSQELLSTGHYNYTFEDIEGLEQYLCMITNDIKRVNSFDKEKWKEFTFESVCYKYEVIVNQLMSNVDTNEPGCE